MPPTTPTFASRLTAWQRRRGRHDLPWQIDRSPYRVWLSEIMLQQTQVESVRTYFARFTERFPALSDLANADEDEVLALWSGLGYYTRARNLLRTARLLASEYGGAFPDTVDALAVLPGIGRSTAAAIVSLAFGKPAAILDGNVKRVLARHAGVAGWPGEKAVETALWREAENRLPASDSTAYTQGMMDLGALVCTRTAPVCDACPVAIDCVASLEARTAEIPAPRPKREKRIEHTQMLVLRDPRGRLLLEKRPGHGVWAGLWSLPQLPVGIDPLGHGLAHWGLACSAHQSLPAFRHVFTHFTLEIAPQLLMLEHPAPVPATSPEHPEQRWLSRAEALEHGLPAPVRRLISNLAE